MPANRFVQLQKAGHLLEVSMDAADILLPGGRLAIGTRNLNSCSGIVILGEAIILAHIAPLPPHPLGAASSRLLRPGEGEVHFNNVFDVVERLYNEHRNLFPDRTTSWAIFGSLGGNIAMPAKLAIAKDRFSAMGLPMRFAAYEVAEPSERKNPAAGTIIGVLQNRKTYLYVEDQIKDSIDFNKQDELAACQPGAKKALPSTSSRASMTTAATSSSTGQTLPESSSVQGFWAFSNGAKQFSYRTPENHPVPHAQWPQLTGRHKVVVVETKQILDYDFDSKQWSGC